MLDIGDGNPHTSRVPDDSGSLFKNLNRPTYSTNNGVFAMKVKTEGSVLTWDFEDGGENVSLDVTTLPDEIRAKNEAHGAKQKIADSYAGAKAAIEEGDYPDAATYAREMVALAIKKLQDGDWTSREPGQARVTDLAVALAEATGFTVEEAQERIADASKEEKASIRKHPQVAAVLARIKAERAAKNAEKAGKAAEETEAPDLAEMFGLSEEAAEEAQA